MPESLPHTYQVSNWGWHTVYVPPAAMIAPAVKLCALSNAPLLQPFPQPASEAENTCGCPTTLPDTARRRALPPLCTVRPRGKGQQQWEVVAMQWAAGMVTAPARQPAAAATEAQTPAAA
eukprot:86422-Prymnesium_polylepis.2